MSWKTFAKDYLSFTKKDRWGFAGVLLLAALIYLLPKLFGRAGPPAGLQEDTLLLKVADTLQKENKAFLEKDENSSFSFYEQQAAPAYTEGTLFRFDPNTLPAEGWQKLGLNNRTIRTIQNYRSKGGRFYKREDLRKIWGLPEGFYNRVADYIDIESARPSYSTTPYSKETAAYNPEYAKGKRSVSVVSVNEADTTALIALPGIGSKLAARIVAFRDKLGGFHSTEQIGETYGLPAETFQSLKPYLQVNAAAIRKININTATKDELRAHPYIRWALANAIVEYRTQHGAFHNLEGLKNIMLMDDSTFRKISPYLSL